MEWPEFRDPSGGVWVWDSESHTYVLKPTAALPEPDRGHATGGDNNLFSPNQIEHSELPGVPELEGYMASVKIAMDGLQDTYLEFGDNPATPHISEIYERLTSLYDWISESREGEPGDIEALDWACSIAGNLSRGQSIRPYVEEVGAKLAARTGAQKVLCPNCQEETDMPQCPTCGKGLAPEWNRKNDKEQEWMDSQAPHSEASEYTSLPERVPKRNRQKTDDSYPSVLSAWDDEFQQYLDSPEKAEIGKWIEDRSGNLHFEHGMQANHEALADRNGLSWPDDLGAMGSVYNDGTADTQRVIPGYPFDLDHTAQKIKQAFGDSVELEPPLSLSNMEPAGINEVQGGVWKVDRPVSGRAWVKEAPDGEFRPNFILCCEHLTPEDEHLYRKGAKAIVTGSGGATSHAAIVASTQGIPAVVGVGPDYMQIESGNHLSFDPNSQTISILPEVSGAQDEETRRQIGQDITDYYRQKDPFVQNKPAFAHALEEEAWTLSHSPSLDSCPECQSPMRDNSKGDKECHTCGHRQPVIIARVVQAGPEMLLAAPLLEGLGEGALGLGEAGGAADIGTVGRLMGGAMSVGAGGNNQNQEETDKWGETPDKGPRPGADPIHQAGTFGEEETGTATKNRGENSDPEHDGSGDSFKEKGDSPELLKDVGGGPKSPDAEKALKAFELNKPLVLEFFQSDEDGSNHPILKALDELLEASFPGYRGHGPDGDNDADDHGFEDSLEDLPEVTSDDNPDAEAAKHDDHKASVFHSFDTGMGMGFGQQPLPNTAAPAANNDFCPKCGQPHDPSVPCPMDVQQPANGMQPMQQPMTPPQPQRVVTHADDDFGDWIRTADDHTPSEQGGDLGADYEFDHTPEEAHEDHHHHHHHEWVDDSGEPLVEGSDYDLTMGDQSVPDRVTVDRILPDKVSVTIHSGDIDYQVEISKEDMATEDYRFSSPHDGMDSIGDDMTQDAPIRPGQDALPQQDDISDTDTKVSSLDHYEGSFDGDDPAARAHLMEGSSSAVEVDPVLLAKLAGKDFDPREQREFIDEDGEARNLDKLDLSGTHYHMDEDLGGAFNW